MLPNDQSIPTPPASDCMSEHGKNLHRHRPYICKWQSHLCGRFLEAQNLTMVTQTR